MVSFSADCSGEVDPVIYNIHCVRVHACYPVCAVNVNHTRMHTNLREVRFAQVKWVLLSFFVLKQ